MSDLQQTIELPDTRRSLRVAFAMILAGVALAIVPLVPNAVLYVLVMGIVACWLVPMWVQWVRGTLDWFEPIHASGFIWVLYFGLGAVWTVLNPGKAAYDRYIVSYIPLATLYCLMGYGMLLVGYYAFWPARRRKQELEEYPRTALFVFVPFVLGFMGFMAQHLWYRAAKLGVSIGGLVSSMGQLAPLFVFAWALTWLLFLSGRAQRSIRWMLFAGMVPAAGIVILLNLNNKSMVSALIGVPLMAWWYAKRRLPIVTLGLLFLLIVFVIFPFNNTYRGLDEHISTGKRLALTSKLIGQWEMEHYLDQSVGIFMARNALINSVAVVVRDVPRWVPYAEGRTIFIPTMVFFVPRLFWPDKPVADFGREFGETFRLLHVADKETHIAATVPGELYWNFSFPGVLVGMLIWGLAMRWYYRSYGESDDLDPVRRAIHMLLLIQFLHFEAGIAQPTVIVIRTLLVLEAYRIFARRFGLVTRVPGATTQAREA